MNSFLDEIISVEEYGIMDTIDIELTGNRLFYANDILTHNCGQNATDFELNEVSESHGISMTSDLMFGFISTPELEQLGHLRVKQLKNRFGNLFAPNSFLIGAHRAKMTLFDVDMPMSGSSAPTANIYAPPIKKADPDAPETMFSNKPAVKNKLKF